MGRIKDLLIGREEGSLSAEDRLLLEAVDRASDPKRIAARHIASVQCVCKHRVEAATPYCVCCGLSKKFLKLEEHSYPRNVGDVFSTEEILSAMDSWAKIRSDDK